jgi:signal transduction histidine kinase
VRGKVPGAPRTGPAGGVAIRQSMAGMLVTPRTMRLSRGQLAAIAVAAVACGFGLVYLLATAEFAADHGLWIAADLVIGFGFVGAGLFAWYRNPGNRTGVLMVATGFAWYVSLLERTEPALLFSIGFALDNLYVAPAVHLLLAYPSGRLESRIDRALVICAYATVTLGFVPIAVLVSPEAYGCVGCPENVFLVQSEPSFGETWLDVLSAIGIVVPLAVVARLVQRWMRASRPLRRTVTPVFLAGAVLMTTLATLLAIVLLVGSTELADVFFYLSLPPLALVPFLFLAGLARGRMLRGRGLGRLVRRLGASLERGELRAALAEALGDPSVEIAYWLPDSRHYVDAEGHPLELPAADSGRSVTEVDRDGRRIAAIVHDPTLLDDQERVREAGAAAALALENERLEAELRAKVEEVRASRSRLVEVGWRQRRRLERDLHDGAQQRLVSLALTLRMARDRLGDGEGDVARLLDRSREELDLALSELRELARGIHPAVLADRGLSAAVRALAERAPLPVEVREVPPERLPEHIELTAYFVISESLTNITKYAAASRAWVSVTQKNGRLLLEVGDDGVGGADVGRGSGLRGLADRLDAIEGRLYIESEPGRGTTVRATMPSA